jgi:CRISPR system Cascade subunit CasE
MFLSRIELNLSDPFARRDTADPYELHSTLCRAFAAPAESNASAVPFLWRTETIRTGLAPTVLVQSTGQPNWSAVLERSRNWAVSLETRGLDPGQYARPGSRWRFRLRANPTITRQGKRHALVRENEQRDWLHRQGERLGFTPIAFEVSDSTRIVTRKRVRGDAPVVVHAATWDGVLTVDRPDDFVQGVRNGIGHAKFLGLGLLSLAGVVA